MSYIRSWSPRKQTLSFTEEPAWERWRGDTGVKRQAQPWCCSVIYKRRMWRGDNWTARAWDYVVAMGTQRWRFPHMGQRQVLTPRMSVWFEGYSWMLEVSCSPLRFSLEAYLSCTPAKLPHVVPKMKLKWPLSTLLISIWLLLRGNQEGCTQCNKVWPQSLQLVWRLKLKICKPLVHSH